MQERLKEIPKKFLEYWNKWTSKQKTIIISAVSVVIVLIGILVFVMGRTKYIQLNTFETTRTASEVVNLLRDNSITVKLSSDNKTVMVDEEQYSEAIMITATSEIAGDEFGIDDLLDTSITTTRSEALLRQHLRIESKLRSAILATEGVSDVEITYIAKDTSNTILESSKSTPVSLMLTTNQLFDEESAVAIAKLVAFAVGNQDTELVVIIDQKGTVLFDGSEPELEDELDFTDKLAMTNYLRNQYIEAVTGAMLMNQFSEVDVAPNLVMNFDKVTQLFTEYIPLDGEIFGVLVEHHEASSEGENGTGDIPGTDSNDEVDYYIDESTGVVYESSSEDSYYEPSVRVTETMYDTGTIVADECSIAVTATRIIELKEEDMEILGLLDDMTFDEYVAQHSEPVLAEPEEELIDIISAATGIPEENIALNTYFIYDYIEREEVTRDWTFYLQILLAVLLIAFLLFVVFRGMAPVEVTELEPELSVEQLLATTKENQSLEDVEFSEQSETRKMIEKFFDENPEAVAQLLRNWLNEEWD